MSHKRNVLLFYCSTLTSGAKEAAHSAVGAGDQAHVPDDRGLRAISDMNAHLLGLGVCRDAVGLRVQYTKGLACMVARGPRRGDIPWRESARFANGDVLVAACRACGM